MLVALVEAPPTFTEKSPPASLAVSSIVTVEPAIRPTSPFGAAIEPSLRTVAAIRPTLPPSEPTLPRLTTLAVEGPEKVSGPPARKLALDTSSVEATKLPPVSTTPVLPTITPLGLIR